MNSWWLKYNVKEILPRNVNISVSKKYCIFDDVKQIKKRAGPERL
jgi:hypothetical protein